MHVCKVKSLGVILVATLTLAIVSYGPFTVAQAAPVPTITVLPPAAPVSIPITIRGTDFLPGAKVDLSWFGFIIDVPGINGHLGNYPLKTGITVGSDGSFSTTIITPSDFSDVRHFINATQNGVGTGIVNATFTIMPRMHLSPQPTNYTEGQQVILHVYGGPLGSPAFFMGVSMFPEITVLKYTYDNGNWGYSTSHLETEGPIVTEGFIGGDIGGNITVRFKAVGGVGAHNIRGYVGGKETPPYLSCEIGGEADFYITGPSPDAKSVLNGLTSLNSRAATIDGDLDSISTRIGSVDGKATNIGTGVSTLQTNLGTVTTSLSGVKGSADNAVNYSIGALSLSAINLIILLAIGFRVFRKA